MPLVSVIVPCYNKPEHLSECLRSIQSQTFTKWECIVVSDGSPRVEEIRAAVKGMADDRFLLVEHEENRGPGAARNTGVRVSHGNFIIFVDEDDKISPNLLSALYTRLVQGSYDITHPAAQRFGGRSDPYPVIVPDRKRCLRGMPLLGAGFLIRRVAWKSAGEFDEHPVLRSGREDFEWWIRAIWAGLKICITPECTYYYRVTAEPIEKGRSLNNRAKWSELEIRQYVVLKHKGKYDQYPDAKRMFLAGGYATKSAVLKRQGKSFAAATAMWMAFFCYPMMRRFLSALGLTSECLIGQRLTDIVRAVIRKLFGLER